MKGAKPKKATLKLSFFNLSRRPRKSDREKSCFSGRKVRSQNGSNVPGHTLQDGDQRVTLGIIEMISTQDTKYKI